MVPTGVVGLGVGLGVGLVAGLGVGFGDGVGVGVTVGVDETAEGVGVVDAGEGVVGGGVGVVGAVLAGAVLEGGWLVTSVGRPESLGDCPNVVPAVLPSALVHTTPEIVVSMGSRKPHSTDPRARASTASVAALASAVPVCAAPLLSVTTVRVASMVTRCPVVLTYQTVTEHSCWSPASEQ